MEGRARLTAELRKGARNAAKVVTRSTDFLKLLSSVNSEFIVNSYKVFSLPFCPPAPLKGGKIHVPLTLCRANCDCSLILRLHSFSFESIIIVTGPSLTDSTCIIAPNSPVETSCPESPVSVVTNLLYKGIALDGCAALI